MDSYGWGFPDYNFFDGQFRNISVGETNWQDFVGEWVLIKTAQNKWIFGKINGYKEAVDRISIFELIAQNFRYTEKKIKDIADIWVVEGWEKFTAAKKDLDVSGKWKTTYGNMILKQSGNKVTGEYAYNNGKIEGILEGNVVEGNWSHQAPDTSGRFEFVFTEAEFKGKWGHDEEELINKWDGAKAG